MPALLSKNPESFTPSKSDVSFVCNVIGVYNLPPPPSPTPSLPLITVTVNESTLSTTSPKSKHPVNLSYRYDSTLTFPLNSTNSNSTATFKVVQSGIELSSYTLNLSSITLSHKNNPEPFQKTLTLHTQTPTNLPPTLRCTLTLTSSYRREVKLLTSTAKGYFNLVDSVSDAVTPSVRAVKSKVVTKYALIPLLPFLVTSACLAPFIAGVGIIGLPLFLPLAALCFLVTLCVSCVMGVFWFSREEGRERVSRLIGGSFKSLEGTKVYQQVVYDFGDRPSAVVMCKTFLPVDAGSRLLLSLLIDFVGSCSYLLPGAGEAFDVFWAPMQTLMLVSMYGDGNKSIKYVSMAEELLPFTDVLPTACLGWMKEHGMEVWEGSIRGKIFKKGKVESVVEKRE
ncbi:hypothetical protein TrVE_jg4607 [Triparma verrucosa]|uniref:Uncharacterized protein n=1 Tax=Triparma verrucosa TaxID=1606542 RepID=A0A9W7BX63_9STRA|nr:hypothetical protein TrVE_jg4607 [Triparma verrucosa]